MPRTNSIKEAVELLEAKQYDDAGLVLLFLRKEEPDAAVTYQLARAYHLKALELKKESQKERASQMDKKALKLLEDDCVKDDSGAMFLSAQIYDSNWEEPLSKIRDCLKRIPNGSSHYEPAQKFLLEVKTQQEISNIRESKDGSPVTESDFQDTIPLLQSVRNFEYSSRARLMKTDLAGLEDLFLRELDKLRRSDKKNRYTARYTVMSQLFEKALESVTEEEVKAAENKPEIRRLNKAYVKTDDQEDENSVRRLSRVYVRPNGTDKPIRRINYAIANTKESMEFTEDDLNNPSETLQKKIEAQLNDKVRGQKDVIGVVSKHIYRHYVLGKRIFEGSTGDELTDLMPIVDLLVGPSSVGKSAISLEAANIMNFPYGIISCADLTRPGIKGLQFQNVFKALLDDARLKYFLIDPESKMAYEEADSFLINAKSNIYPTKNPEEIVELRTKHQKTFEDVEKKIVNFAEALGVIVLDEFDKIADTKGDTVVSGQSVQNQLLYYFNGKTPIEVSISDTHSQNPMAERKVIYNLKNTLIFLTGAFQDIERVLEKQPVIATNSLEPSASDFKASEFAEAEMDNPYQGLSKQHLVAYGISQQLCARISNICILKKLSQDVLKEIFVSRWSASERKHHDKVLYPDIGQFSRIHFSSAGVTELIGIYSQVDGARGIDNLVNELPNLIGNHVRRNKADFRGIEELEVTPAIVRKALSYSDTYKAYCGELK